MTAADPRPRVRIDIDDPALHALVRDLVQDQGLRCVDGRELLRPDLVVLTPDSTSLVVPGIQTLTLIPFGHLSRLQAFRGAGQPCFVLGRPLSELRALIAQLCVPTPRGASLGAVAWTPGEPPGSA